MQSRTHVSVDEADFLSKFTFKILDKYEVGRGKWTAFTDLAADSVFTDLWRHHADLRLIVVIAGVQHEFSSYDTLTRYIADQRNVPRPNPRTRTAGKTKEWIANNGGNVEFKLEQWVPVEQPLEDGESQGTIIQQSSVDESNLLLRLPHEQRIVLMEIYQEGLSTEQVADRTRMSVPEVESAMEKALARLSILQARTLPKDDI